MKHRIEKPETVMVIVNIEYLYGRNLTRVKGVINSLQTHHYTTMHAIAPKAWKEMNKEFLNNENISKLIIAGGDGFINLILQDWKRYDVPIGFIPIGSANLLAKECGYTKNIKHIAQILQTSFIKKTYCAKVNQHLFFTVAGCGLDGYTIASISDTIKFYFGRFYIALSFLKTLLTKKYPPFKISLNGKPPVEASTILFAKGHYYAGSFNYAPRASIFNDKLYVLHFKGSSVLHELKIVLCVILNKLSYCRDVFIVPVKNVKIYDPSKQPIQLDGDINAKTPAVISVYKQPRYVICDKNKI